MGMETLRPCVCAFSFYFLFGFEREAKGSSCVASIETLGCWRSLRADEFVVAVTSRLRASCVQSGRLLSRCSTILWRYRRVQSAAVRRPLFHARPRVASLSDLHHWSDEDSTQGPFITAKLQSAHAHAVLRGSSYALRFALLAKAGQMARSRAAKVASRPHDSGRLAQTLVAVKSLQHHHQPYQSAS